MTVSCDVTEMMSDVDIIILVLIESIPKEPRFKYKMFFFTQAKSKQNKM